MPRRACQEAGFYRAGNWIRFEAERSSGASCFCGDQSRTTAFYQSSVNDRGNAVHELLSDYFTLTETADLPLCVCRISAAAFLWSPRAAEHAAV